MAGDWIPMRTQLRDDLPVIAIATATGLDPDTVVGKLHRCWSWAQEVTADGNAPGVTVAWLDAHIGAPGFAEAMIAVGWLEDTQDGLVFPEFDRYMGKGAKKRLSTARRVAEHRRCNADRNAESNADRNAESNKTALPIGEKRREEKKKNPPPSPPEGGGAGGSAKSARPKRDAETLPDDLPAVLDNPEFRSAWDDWGRHRREIRHRLTPTAAQRQIKKLAAAAETGGVELATAMIETSIENGWQKLADAEQVSGHRANSTIRFPDAPRRTPPKSNRENIYRALGETP